MDDRRQDSRRRWEESQGITPGMCYDCTRRPHGTIDPEDTDYLAHLCPACGRRARAWRTWIRRWNRCYGDDVKCAFIGGYDAALEEPR